MSCELRCPEWRGGLTELSRNRRNTDMPRLAGVNGSGAALAHMNFCPECRRFFEAQLALSDAEMALADEVASIPPPAELERLVIAQYAARARVRRGGFARPAMAAVGIAAALVCAWLVLPRPALLKLPKPAPEVRLIVAAPAILPAAPKPEIPNATVRRVRRRPAAVSPAPAAAAPANTEEPFLEIPYTIPLDPRERAAVVRMEMPVAALTAVGLTVPTADSSASAQADVIVGEDGRMRAIRVLSISNPNSDRSQYR